MIILTSRTQNLLRHVGQGHREPNQLSGSTRACSCLEANLRWDYYCEYYMRSQVSTDHLAMQSMHHIGLQ